jgi:CopG family nickel-responsive transcriptional regulator
VERAITLVYDHHGKGLLNKITDIQHNYEKLIISTQHVHISHENCLEIIAIRGNPKDVQKLADTLQSIKGVKHGTLSMSSTGKDIE